MIFEIKPRWTPSGLMAMKVRSAFPDMVFREVGLLNKNGKNDEMIHVQKAQKYEL
jgi:hypothetical protein